MALQAAEHGISALNSNDAAKAIRFLSDVLSNLGHARSYLAEETGSSGYVGAIESLEAFYQAEVDRLRKGIPPTDVAAEIYSMQGNLWEAGPLLTPITDI